MYTQAMQMAFCQKTVMGLFLFHVQDEACARGMAVGRVLRRRHAEDIAAGDRGGCRDRAPRRRRVVPRPAADAEARCPRIEADEDGYEVRLTCSLDCTYTVSLDKRRLTGSAVGRVATTLLFKGALPPGRHVVAARASALMNAGPPASARLSFSSR